MSVTTVIPAYNGERFLRATLESLANQIRRPDRVILLDDQSTDGTVALAESFTGIHVDIIKNPANLGLFGNHRRAVELAAETDYWHLLHTDDVVMPDFFSTLLPPLEEAPAGSFAYGEHEFIGIDGQRIAGSNYPLPPGTGPVSRQTVLVEQSELRSIQVHAGILKTSRQPAPCQFRTDLPQSGDVAFHAELAARSPFLWRTDRVLCQARWHENQESRKNALRLQAAVMDEWRVMRLAAGLIEEPPLQRWIRHQKLQCLWAARSVVKIQRIRDSHPEYAGQIKYSVKKQVGLMAWLAGLAAVQLRDACAPRRISGT